MVTYGFHDRMSWGSEYFILVWVGTMLKLLLQIQLLLQTWFLLLIAFHVHLLCRIALGTPVKHIGKDWLNPNVHANQDQCVVTEFRVEWNWDRS